MLVSIDLTGDMISYAILDGESIEKEILRNTIGFRTAELFRIDGAIGGLMRVAKDMIELSEGEPITEAICVLPQYVGYADRERVKKAAADCGLKIRRVITGSLAAAYGLFQISEPEKKTILLSVIRSDYAEFQLYEVDGDVLRTMGSAMAQYEKDPVKLDPEKLKKKLLSELKAMYGELGLAFGEKKEEVYLTFDERSEYLKSLFAEILEPFRRYDPLFFENDAVRGAFSHLLRINSIQNENIRKCVTQDCCIEGISICSGGSGDLQQVFRRNTPIPAQSVVELPVTSDNVLNFYAGNYRNREYDEPIGSCRIPVAYRGQNVIVKITLNEEAIVEYVVLDAKRQIIYPRQILK